MAKKKKKARGGGKKRGGGFGGGLPGMGGMGGGGGMGNLMNQMQKLQEEMEKTQEALGGEEVTGTSGGGMVTVVVTGDQQVKSIKIKPEAVDPDDVEMLEDLVMAAITEAMQKANALSEEKMGGLTSGMGLPPGLGL